MLMVWVQLLNVGLPMMGVRVGDEQLTITIQTIIAIVSALWIWIRRVQAGGVNIAGVRE